MELGGDEKRIQALFSELAFEDQSRVPQFDHLWTRAQARKEISTHRIGRLVLVSLLVTAAACSLAAWTWYKSSQSPLPNIVAVQLPPVEVLHTAVQPVKTEPLRQKHIARRRQVDRSVVTEAALLSSWQSPTQQFMSSPTELTMGSLPQLNQSVKDLESFLSKNSEIMKESNR
jgi:hypothetical protein